MRIVWISCFIRSRLLGAGILLASAATGCPGQVIRQPLTDVSTITTDRDQLTLTYGGVSMSVDAQRGARIVSFSREGDQVLLQSAPDLPNFGSTFWVAPQRRWGWPPYEALHTAPYQAAHSGDSLVLTGGIGEESRYQAIKTIWFDATAEAFSIRYTLINHADTVRSVGPWEVTAVPAGGLTFFRKNLTIDPLPQSTLPFTDTLGISFLHYPPNDTTPAKQKLFAFARDGWLAHVTDKRTLFVKKFESVPPANIAPGQGEVEVFVNTHYGYIELENHGRYQPLGPSERMHYRVQWLLRELPDSIPTDRISQSLIDFTQETINR